MREFLKRAIRPAWYPIYRAGVRRQCRREDRAHPPSGTIPPALLRFRVSGTPSLDDFLEVGRRTADNLDAALSAAGCSIAAWAAALDFGCGCGRTLRWMLDRYPNARFSGCDVDRDAVEWCAAHLPGARFAANDPAPPLPFAEAEFDVLWAVSVFTHLDLEPARAWLAELARVLRPGGVAVLTFHGERAWAGTAVESEVRKRGFLFQRTRKLSGFCPDWYQTSYHTEAFARAELSRAFRVLAYLPGGMGFQDAAVLERH